MAREVIHWSYRHGDWQGVPWQEVQPYELLARLLYLHRFDNEDFLKALEQGELSLESEGRFVPSAWLMGRPEALPLTETVWNLEAIGGEGVRESWWVGLFFYQLPWEWYRLVKGVAHEPDSLLEIAPFLRQMWHIWYDMEVVLSGYGDSFYPAVAVGWSLRHQRELERIAQAYLHDYEVPEWWLALRVEGKWPFSGSLPRLRESEWTRLQAIERAFSWLAKFVSVPYDAWSLHWVFLEVMSVFRQLQQGWLAWMRHFGR
jgi:hypothetical protein